MAPPSDHNQPPAVSNESILHHLHELSRTKRKLDEATAAHRLGVKRAKADGVPTEALLESIAWSRLEPEERVKRMIDRVRVMSLRDPDAAQEFGDMFTRMDAEVSEKMRFTDTLFDSETRGYAAGKAGVSVEDNPYQPGTEMHVNWRTFWGQGQAAAAATMGDKAKAADTSRKRPAAKKARQAELISLPARKAGRKRPGRQTDIEEFVPPPDAA